MSTRPQAPAWPDGYGRLEYESVDSTLDEARRLAPGLSGPTWIFARRQSRARGRRGRAWHQGEGNFAATVLLPAPGEPEHAALRSFVTALALGDVLEGLGVESALKWPNDVLVDGAKLAGILLEGLPGGALAIGIGVNLASAPVLERLEPDATAPVALAERGVEVAPEVFLHLLANAYSAREASFAAYGFAPIRAAWLARAARLGAPIKVRLAQETLAGTFKDVDEGGRLVLSTAQGIRRIAAGDVFF